MSFIRDHVPCRSSWWPPLSHSDSDSVRQDFLVSAAYLVPSTASPWSVPCMLSHRYDTAVVEVLNTQIEKHFMMIHLLRCFLSILDCTTHSWVLNAVANASQEVSLFSPGFPKFLHDLLIAGWGSSSWAQ